MMDALVQSCPSRAYSEVSRNLPGRETELADGSSPTQRGRDKDRASRRHEHSWSLPRRVGLAAETQLSPSSAHA